MLDKNQTAPSPSPLTHFCSDGAGDKTECQLHLCEAMMAPFSISNTCSSDDFDVMPDASTPYIIY